MCVGPEPLLHIKTFSPYLFLYLSHLNDWSMIVSSDTFETNFTFLSWLLCNPCHHFCKLHFSLWWYSVTIQMMSDLVFSVVLTEELQKIEMKTLNSGNKIFSMDKIRATFFLPEFVINSDEECIELYGFWFSTWMRTSSDLIVVSLFHNYPKLPLYVWIQIFISELPLELLLFLFIVLTLIS